MIISRTKYIPKLYKIIIGLFVLVVCALGFFALYFAPSPPLDQIELFQKSFQKVRTVQAELYAPQQYADLEKKWLLLMNAWQLENQKWILKRNYNSIRISADSLILLAEVTEYRAVHHRDSLINVLENGIPILQEKMNTTKELQKKYPPKAAISQSVVRSELLLREAQSAYTKKNYLQAYVSLKKAAVSFGVSEQRLTLLLEDYKKQLPLWLAWSNETIVWSKKNRKPAIIVDKISHKCYLYKNGILNMTYPVELGIRWMGRKTVSGDAATPEGRYQITLKKNRGNSKYYKALVINYPNADDKRHFSNLKKGGRLPVRASIGGSIELHGEGGKGYDWTQGCIALENGDMDQLFNAVHIGTPVTIVGSMK